IQCHPGGQGTTAHLPAAALLNHFVHETRRQNLRNGAEAEPVQRMLSRLTAGACGLQRINGGSMETHEASSHDSSLGRDSRPRGLAARQAATNPANLAALRHDRVPETGALPGV